LRTSLSKARLKKQIVLTLHPIERRDIAAIVSWFPDRQSVIYWGGAKVPDPLTAEWLVEQTEVNSYWVWRDEKDAPIGMFGLVLPADSERAHLMRFGLAPHWRSRGLGKLLFAQILNVARGHGMTQMSLNVYETNAAARRLYEWHGFTIAERKPPVADWSGDNLHMMLSL
jgi:ribosomal protein S18 acetylase RimI-like enzyme